jgi:hypothetical protein
VIILTLGTFCNTAVSGITDSSGLSFILRVSHNNTNSCFETVWEYYAVAKAPLNGDNITVLVDRCCIAILGMQVFAIHGANTLRVFDPDPSIPAAVSCPSTSCGNCTANFGQGTCAATIRTSTFDFVVATTAINDAGPCGPHYLTGQVPGFTGLVPNQRNRFEIDYTITSAPHTSVVFACNGTDASVIVVDAISFKGAFGL